MDVNKRVNYEKVFSLSIKDPVSEDDVGIEMGIRSNGSEACKAIYRKHADEMLEMRYKGKRIKGRQAEREELERTAACIANWTWNKDPSGEENTFHGEKPVLSMAKAIKVLEEIPWIYAQVKEAADKTENFTGSSETSSSES